MLSRLQCYPQPLHVHYLMFPVGVLAFKCMKGQAPSYLSDRFVPRSTVHDRKTRNKDCLNIPPYQSGQRTFLYRAIKQLNSGTHCHVRSLLQTACVLSKLSARRDAYWCFYLLLQFWRLDILFNISNLPYDLFILTYVRWVWKTLNGRFNKIKVLL